MLWIEPATGGTVLLPAPVRLVEIGPVPKMPGPAGQPMAALSAQGLKPMARSPDGLRMVSLLPDGSVELIEGGRERTLRRPRPTPAPPRHELLPGLPTTSDCPPTSMRLAKLGLLPPAP